MGVILTTYDTWDDPPSRQVDLGAVGHHDTRKSSASPDLTCLTNRPYNCFLRRQAYNNMEDVWGTKKFGNVSFFHVCDRVQTPIISI